MQMIFYSIRLLIYLHTRVRVFSEYLLTCCLCVRVSFLIYFTICNKIRCNNVTIQF